MIKDVHAHDEATQRMTVMNKRIDFFMTNFNSCRKGNKNLSHWQDERQKYLKLEARGERLKAKGIETAKQLQKNKSCICEKKIVILQPNYE